VVYSLLATTCKATELLFSLPYGYESDQNETITNPLNLILGLGLDATPFFISGKEKIRSTPAIQVPS